MPAPVTLMRGRSQATIVSRAPGAWEVTWKVAGQPDRLGVLNSGVPLQVSLNVDEPAEFFYRKLGASSEWLPVQTEGGQ